AVPVEDAMDTIAKAAKASWRRIYVMKINSLPQTSAPRESNRDPKTAETASHADPKQPALRPWSNHVSYNPDGKPTKFAKRDWKHPSKRTGGPAIRGGPYSMEDMQKQAMMGLYGPLFLLDSEAGRATAMKNFQAGLENQLKRLAALPASQRSITTMMTRT